MATITISEDLEPVLLKVFELLPQRHDELSLEEKLQLAAEALINSYDTQIEDEMEDGPEPINAEALRDAMAEVTSPNISTTFVQPKGEAKPVRRIEYIYDDIVKMAPTIEIVKALDAAAAQADADPLQLAVCQRAAEITLSRIPRAEWDTEQTKRLYGSTVVMLIEQRGN